LNSLPLTLDATYERILLRIDPAQVSLARVALEFVIFSMRPPTLDELAEAAAVGSYDGPFDIGNRLFEPEDILRMCSSLLVLEYPDLDSPKMDDESDSEDSVVDLNSSETDNPNPKPPTVKPAHYTVSEYIQSTRIRSSPAKFFAMSRDSGDASLAKICLRYLLIFNDLEPLGATVSKEYPLLKYAPKFWHRHVTSTVIQRDEVTVDLLMKFLDIKGFCFLNCIRLWDPDSYGERKKPHLQPGNMLSPPYYLCRVGACCELVKFAVDMGFDANEHGDYGSTLQAASYFCHDVNTLSILLAAGAEVNALGGRYDTALNASVACRFEEGVARLLDAGADPNMRGYAGGRTALHWAVKFGSCQTDSKSVINILHRILHAGANINGSAQNGGPPLALATSGPEKMDSLRMDAIRILVQAGADVNLSGGNSLTPLQCAAASGNMEIVNYLLEAGADVNAITSDDVTALGAAANAGDIQIVRRLLQAGAEINLVAKDCAGVLFEAAHSGNIELLNFLLDAGADVKPIRDGTTLRAAARSGDIDMVKRLIQAGAEVKSTEASSAGFLQAAAGCRNVEVLRFLIDAGAVVNSRDGSDETALEVAARWRDVLMVRQLLQAGAEVNMAGGKALQEAARYGNIEVQHHVKSLNATPHFAFLPLHPLSIQITTTCGKLTGIH